MAEFDWYQATVPEPPAWLASALRDQYEGASLERVKSPNYRYRHASAVVVGDRVCCHIMSDDRYEHPHVLATSDEAALFAPRLRDIAPEHSVSRVDVADDFTEPGLYDRWYPRIVALAQAHQTTLGCAGDWVTDNPSRTLYAGSPKSPNRIRFYEKTPQLRSAVPQCFHRMIPEHWTRLETQTRPDRAEARAQLATLSPDAVYGVSALGVAVANELLGRSVDRVRVGTVWRQSDHDRAVFHAASQYGRCLLHEADLLGDDGPLAQRIRLLFNQAREVQNR